MQPVVNDSSEGGERSNDRQSEAKAREAYQFYEEHPVLSKYTEIDIGLYKE